MNLYIRLFIIWLKAIFDGKRLTPFGESVIHLRVLPNDLDVYGHMNNSRYLALMDQGRIDLVMRTGIAKVSDRNKWNPIVASVNIQYKRSLKLFESFKLCSRILGWDDKWIFIEQRFERNSHVIAYALVKALFRSAKQSIPPQELLSAIGESKASPPLPYTITQWLESEKQYKEKY